jgi:ABC-2 type transport system ATP-binding protein
VPADPAGAPPASAEPGPSVRAAPVTGPDRTVAAIRTEALTKLYGAVTAVSGLTMTVPQGEVFGFLGPNGAGKTTSVKLLLGLARPTSGSAWVLGEPAGHAEVRRRVGYLPELFRYQAWLSAYEVLQLHCELARVPRDLWRGEIERSLVTVGLAERAHSRVGTFSKGMQQRLGLGVALLGRPEVVFLDEPTSALDPVGRKDVRDVIRHLKGLGVTVFLNSHLLSEVEQVCDRVAIVHHGTVIASGSLGSLLAESGVRIHATGTGPEALARLGHHGTVRVDGEWLSVGGVGPDAVPELVAELVAAGARVYAVEPHHQTLEERFIELLGGQH